MSLCSTCSNQNDKGKSVSTALYAAREAVKEGKTERARQEYNFIAHLLIGRNGCQSCIREIENERDRNT